MRQFLCHHNKRVYSVRLLAAALAVCLFLSGCRSAVYRGLVNRPNPNSIAVQHTSQEISPSLSDSSGDVPSQANTPTPYEYEPEVGTYSSLEEAQSVVAPRTADVPDVPRHFSSEILDPTIARTPSMQSVLLTIDEFQGRTQKNDDGDVIAIDLSFTSTGDTQLLGLYQLPHLLQLDLTGTSISDDGMALVAQVEWMQSLKLKGTRISDAGLASLVRLQQLQLLDLSRTSISDQGIQHVAACSQLRFLSLNGTSVSDLSIAALGTLSRLQGLNIIDTKISAEGVRKLRSLLPDSVIVDGVGAAMYLPEAIAMQLAFNRPTYQPDADIVQTPGMRPVSQGTSVSLQGIGVHAAGDSPHQLILMTELAARKPELAVTLSEVYSNNERWSDAVMILKAANEVDPRNAEIRFRLGEAMARCGREQEASDYFASTVGEAAASYNMGLIAYEAMLKKCERYFQDSVSSNPGQASAQLRLAEIRAELSAARQRRSAGDLKQNSHVPQIIPGTLTSGRSAVASRNGAPVSMSAERPSVEWLPATRLPSPFESSAWDQASPTPQINAGGGFAVGVYPAR